MSSLKMWKLSGFKLLILVTIIIVTFVFLPVLRNLEAETKSSKHISTDTNYGASKSEYRKCGNFANYAIQPFTEAYVALKLTIQREVERNGGQKTGHVAMIPWKESLLLSVIKNRPYWNVCETGFNSGNSALMWLYGNADIHVYSFDLGIYKYGRPVAHLLNYMFPGRLNLTWGDSKKTIPEFSRRNPLFGCDFIFVDGGHGYRDVLADLRNLRVHANRKSLIVIDDAVEKGVMKAWKEEINKGHIKEHCILKGYSGTKTFGGKNTTTAIGIGEYIWPN